MRVVSGKLKGRRFTPPSNFKARPTTDIAREALFNILVHSIDFDGLHVLDLFAGTGAISYEFASRGCEKITTVEKQYSHFKFIQERVGEFGLTGVITPVKNDAFAFIRHQAKHSYDLVFADPPFDLPNFESVVPAILETEIIKPGGLLILEHSGKHDFTAINVHKQTRVYGKVCFTFFSPGNT